MAHRGEAHCRVCLTGACYDDALVAPCQCRDEQRWVHTRCLEAWRAKSDDPHRCEVCGEVFHLPPPPSQSQRGRHRRRSWWQPALLALGVAALAVGGFWWAEVAGRRRLEAKRRQEARERKRRMREQRQLMTLVDKELKLVLARMALLSESARQGRPQEGWAAAVAAGAGQQEEQQPGQELSEDDAAPSEAVSLGASASSADSATAQGQQA